MSSSNYDPLDKPSLKQIQATARNAFRIAVAALLLAVLLGLGYGLWVGLADRALNEHVAKLEKSLESVKMETMMIQSELLENLLNLTTVPSSPVTWTVVESGSVQFRMVRVNPQDYIFFNEFFGVPANQGIDFLVVDYTVQVAHVGPLNFTYLVIDTLSRPLTTQNALPPLSGQNLLGFQLVAFQPIPTLLQADLTATGIRYPLTPSNFAKLNLSPNCLMTSECYQASGTINAFPIVGGPQTQSITLSTTGTPDDPVPYPMIHFYIQGLGPYEFESSMGSETTFSYGSPLYFFFPSA